MKFLMPFITRAYNRITYNIDNLSILKSSETDRLLDEIEYYKQIPNELKCYFPQIYSFNQTQKPYNLELEYYSYKNIAYYLIHQSHGLKFWESIITLLFNSIEKFKNNKSSISDDQAEKYILEMFVDKTENEYLNLKTKFNYFTELCSAECFILNKKKYLNFEKIWPNIKLQLTEIIKNNRNFNFIHGDMCFSNILLGYNSTLPDKTIKFIDPRGSFGSKGCYGSSIYDYSKLLHSIDGGYEYFIYDEYKLIEENKFNYSLEYSYSDNKNIALNIFKSYTTPNNYAIYSLIEGLIFVSMCARHYDDINRQKAMYITGVKLLNEALN